MKLSHINKDNRPEMVDVGSKPETDRTAHARAVVIFPRQVLSTIQSEGFHTSKGPVFDTAIIAGVMAAKKTSELIPFCHPLRIDDCNIDITLADEEGTLTIDCQVSARDRTGVEMEALTGASVAALTVYDMCKSLSHDIIIREIRLLEKSGGRSGSHVAAE